MELHFVKGKGSKPDLQVDFKMREHSHGSESDKGCEKG